MIQKVNLAEKLALIDRYWTPKVVGELNGQYVKLVKFSGPFVWHHHQNEDELFLVLEGSFTMKLRDRDLELGPGELVVVPRGVEHMPVAETEVHVLLFEPKATLNTGNAADARTVPEPEWI